jgi:3-hydroxybutyryl-CoA dehydrogenase
VSPTIAAALAKDSIVAVIGAGAMGAGIAQIAAVYGHRVQLHDTRMGAGDAAKRGIAEALDKQVERGRLARAEADAALGRIATVVALPDVCVAQLVVEAIVEDLGAKRELFQRVENVVDDACIVASNTSSISITALAAGMQHPGRIVGMHFFNPAPLMPLVEVVSGLATSTATAERVFATAQAWGKTPVYASSTPGFIVNRCARPYYAEGLRLLSERAADVATLDAVLREAGGFRMGPFELIDLIGLDVNLAVTKSVWAAYFHDPRYAPSVLQEERVTAGFFGRKSGRGFYDYSPGAAKPVPGTEKPLPAPSHVTVHGDLGIAAALAERIAAGGVAVERARADSRFPAGAIHVPGSAGGAWLALTDGRTATKRVGDCGVRDLVLFDLALDYATATRVAVASADTCGESAYSSAVGTLQAGGLKVSRLDDVAGLAVLRIVAMLANEAADATVQGVAAPAAIDIAMQKGVNYPRGPIAWADALGAATVRDALANLAAHYGEDRYRISPLIARRAAAGGQIGG